LTLHIYYFKVLVKLINDRPKDFEFLLNSKSENYYISTAEYSEKPLERESFTNFIKKSAKQMDRQPNLSIHLLCQENLIHCLYRKQH
jgi:hypothetical protein